MTEDYIRNIRCIRDIRGRRIGDPPFHKGDSEVSPPRNGRLGGLPSKKENGYLFGRDTR